MRAHDPRSRGHVLTVRESFRQPKTMPTRAWSMPPEPMAMPPVSPTALRSCPHMSGIEPTGGGRARRALCKLRRAPRRRATDAGHKVKSEEQKGDDCGDGEEPNLEAPIVSRPRSGNGGHRRDPDQEHHERKRRKRPHPADQQRLGAKRNADTA